MIKKTCNNRVHEYNVWYINQTNLVKQGINMGVLVADKTKWVCDEDDCSNESRSSFDQEVATKHAEDDLFSKCSITGKVTCFECRKNKHKT